MSDKSHRGKFNRLLQAAIPGAYLVHLWPLEGGVSAQVTAMEVSGPDGSIRKLVVRQHGKTERERNPDIARDEYRVLELLASQEMAAPSPVYVDPEGVFFDDTCLIVEFMSGDPNFDPTDQAAYLMQMAGHLSLIHTLNCAGHELDFLPAMTDLGTELIATKGGNGVAPPIDNLVDVMAIVKSNWPLTQHNSSVLLHGDFWPGNLICEGDRITGVIDWEDASTGDPLSDVANTRLEVLWAFGQDAMALFTEHYIRNSKPDITNLAYWDLFAALRRTSAFTGWIVGHSDEDQMRDKYRYFIDQALKQLQ